MMTYIGIDVSSKKLNFHIMGGKEISFEIRNTKEDLEWFIKLFSLSPKDCIVGAESTGRYHLVCQRFFIEKWFEFKLINPILTNKKISLTIRKKKTDISDAKMIAELLAGGHGETVTRKQLDTTKKSIMRTRSTVVQHRSAIKLVIKELKKDELNTQLEQTINSLNVLIENFDECVKDLENIALKDCETTETEKLIRTIPGFAERLSAVVATEVGDFSRFPSSAQFKAYVGIDPGVKQSGNMQITTKITKRWNSLLRHSIYLAAQVARQHDPELKAFYEKKISEWKHFKVAMCAVVRKLCERIYAIVKKWEPYYINNSLSLNSY